MIEGRIFLSEASGRGFNFFTGVPCSYLKPFINGTISDPVFRYVGATSEGEAIGLAFGASLAGNRSVVMCQNSGLGNMVNPLTSLNTPFRVPVLLIITWRGQPGRKDEPQHELMGRITHSLLGTMGIPWLPFPDSDDAVAGVLDTVEDWFDQHGLPFALVMEDGAVAEMRLDEGAGRMQPRQTPDVVSWLSNGDAPSRIDVLSAIREALPDDTLFIATTGKCGRELFTVGDRPNQLYVVGSMGCASAIGLGLALNTECRVVVLDGDGAALMKMGNMATIGAYGPANLTHVILDNGVHDSTGEQSTVSMTTDFAGVARSCNYASSFDIDSLADVAKAMAAAVTSGGPALVRVRVRPGSPPDLGRPTVTPAEVARRFAACVRQPPGA